MPAQTRTRTGSRSDIRGARFIGVLLLAGSVIAAVVCTYMATVMLPTTLEQYGEYKAAEACPDTLPVRGSQNCVRTVTFTVQHTVVHDGGGAPSTTRPAAVVARALVTTRRDRPHPGPVPAAPGR